MVEMFFKAGSHSTICSYSPSQRFGGSVVGERKEGEPRSLGNQFSIALICGLK